MIPHNEHFSYCGAYVVYSYNNFTLLLKWYSPGDKMSHSALFLTVLIYQKNARIGDDNA